MIHQNQSTRMAISMDYQYTYRLLLSSFDQSKAVNQIPGHRSAIHNCRFTSRNTIVLPGAARYTCEDHGKTFPPDFNAEDAGRSLYHESLDVFDCHIDTNSEFSYSVFQPEPGQKAKSVVLMFHGLNEKVWDKYLPWAFHVMESTGKAVILFPIAFHMNRTPHRWSDQHTMGSVSELRKKLYPAIANSTFANAAISTRLQENPQRFFWSGLQTFFDVVDFVWDVRTGQNPQIETDAHIDIFAYSIGSFLSELLLMINPENLFSDSRLFIFCGGPTLDRMYPCSKYIMDSEAVLALHAFLIEQLDNEFKRHPRLAHYFLEHHEMWDYFRGMLSNPKMKPLREKRFRELSDRIQALALRQDDVILPVEVLNTLQGDFRDIPIQVHLMDFPYPYLHVNPFPDRNAIAPQVDESFHRAFEPVIRHLR